MAIGAWPARQPDAAGGSAARAPPPAVPQAHGPWQACVTAAPTPSNEQSPTGRILANAGIHASDFAT